MSEDKLILLFCYLIYGITLSFLVFRSKKRLKTLSINLIILGLYSGILLYNLIYNSSGGSGLLWFVYLIFFIGIHWLINFVRVIMTFKSK